MGSPILLYNICRGSMDTATIHLRASPFGSRPALPTANNVTLARVASPLSMDPSYQTQFMHGLKNYFDFTKRFVKRGDLVAVGIDPDALHQENGHADKLDISSEEAGLSDYR
jgi:peroxin-6